MILYNLKDKQEYTEEFVLRCHEEWGSPWNKKALKKN